TRNDPTLPVFPPSQVIGKFSSGRCSLIVRISRLIGIVFAVLVLSSAPLGAQQNEPLAGTWKTWILVSGSQLRLPPPAGSVFGTEISELKALESQRTAAAIDTVRFWDTGSPGFRWIEMLYPLGSGAS